MASDDGFYHGTIEIDLTLIDLVQLGMVINLSGQILVKSGDKMGTIHFQNGQVIHAETPSLQGTDGFYEIVTWRGGEFMVTRREADVTRTIAGDLNSLLVEAARLQDESGLLRPGTEAVFDYELTEMQAAYWDMLANEARTQADAARRAPDGGPPVLGAHETRRPPASNFLRFVKRALGRGGDA